MSQGGRTIPFIGATLPYREKFASVNKILTSATQDASPTGNAIKTGGFLRAVRLNVTTSAAASTGGTLNADGPFNVFNQVQVSQPGGEEMFGSALFNGYHAFLAAAHSGWKRNNNPKTWPSFSSSVTSPSFDLPINFEFGPHGLGSLPNQDFSAPWQLSLTYDAVTQPYQTAPTTTNPTIQTDMYIDAWTVPSDVNPLSGEPQQTRPIYVGALSKWTRQKYAITASSSQDVDLIRRGNSYRNLVFIVRNGTGGGSRVAASKFPAPLALRWDGALIRQNDTTTLWIDDEYMTEGGVAAATPLTAETGVIALQMAAPFGEDTQASDSNGLGMWQYWGTTQSSTITLSGTWGSGLDTLEVLTNDVLITDLSGNPYTFAGGMFLQAPAQRSARP